MTDPAPAGLAAGHPDTSPKRAGSASSRRVPVVPAGSTALRELCHAVVAALTIPDPAVRPGLSSVQSADEAAWLQLLAERAALVLWATRRILADRETDDRDVMVFVASMRGRLTDYPPDGYHHHAGLSS